MKPVGRTAPFLLALLMFGFASLFEVEAADGPTFRRFALYVGSNDGGKERTTLRYATSDARSLASVMSELGGVSENDAILLTDPTATTVDRGFRQIKDRIARLPRANMRVEFLLYYSGHSDEQGLLLGNDRMPYSALRSSIEATGADVKIAILDSCSSGAFTRLKGGTRHSAFLVDESVSTTGHAFLTSSSDNEAAQESDRIGASFFTYYFVSALRGAADTAGRGKVTLNEAYSYASAETLARTADTEAGPQHPSYEIRLSGSGDLVLTDLRETNSSVQFDSDVQGRLFVRDGGGRLVAELRKSGGSPILLSLPAGRYAVSLEQAAALFQTNVVLRNGSRQVVGARDFSPVVRETTRSRGESREELDHVSAYFGLIPPFPPVSNHRVVHNVALSIMDDSYRVEGIDVALGTAIREDVRGSALGALFNVAGRDVAGFQGAGVFNVAGGVVSGSQASGVFNFATGPLYGFQAAGVFNVSNGAVNGLQSGGVFNIANGDLRGAQGAGVFNVTAGDAAWFQGAGVFNTVAGDFGGVQGAGVFNVTSGSVSGLQTAGVFNVVGGEMRGFEAAGVVNVAHGLRGVQAGTVNVAGGEGAGGQLGVVNVAGTLYGVQVGLINISKELYGIPIGLINISANGLFNPGLWTDQLGTGYVGFQMGAGNLYTLLYAGGPLTSASTSGAVGAGIGFHFPIESLYIDLDVSAKHPFTWSNVQSVFGSNGINLGELWSTPDQTFPSMRASVGMKLAGPLALFGGVTFDCNIPGVNTKSEFHSGTSIPLTFGSSDTLIELYPKWFVGLRL